MKIADLVRASGTSRSAIHHYRNLGLLPPARVLGPKLHVYGREHVERLREIAKLRAERGLSLRELRRRFAGRAPPRGGPAPGAGRRRGPRAGGALAEAILDAATRMFIERGFDAVNVGDVARAAGVGKATLYKCFRSKAALFVECIERLRLAAVSAEDRLLVAAGSGLLPDDEMRLRATAVLARFGPFRMMTNLLSVAAYGDDVETSRRARLALHRMITNVEPGLRAAMAAGAMRAVDSEMLAYMAWGALMAVGDRMQLDGRYSLAEAVEFYLDAVSRVTRP